MESGNRLPAARSIASAPLRASCSGQTLGPFDRICPVRSATSALWATDRVRHPPVVAPSGYDRHQYWRCDALELRGRDHRRLSMTARHLVGPMETPKKTQAHEGRSMSFYRGMTCENVTIEGDKGTPITAYVARPSGHGPFPGRRACPPSPGLERVLHRDHAVGSRITAIFAICANLYEREGGGSDAATRTTSRPRCAPRAAACRLPDDRRYRSRRELDTRASLKSTTARLVSSAPARAAGTPSSMPANGRTSMPASNNGGAVW